MKMCNTCTENGREDKGKCAIHDVQVQDISESFSGECKSYADKCVGCPHFETVGTDAEGCRKPACVK